MRIGIVAKEVETLVGKVEDVIDRRVNRHRRQFPRRALQLQACLVEMVAVEMRVAEGMDELAGLQPADPRDHHRQQRVGRDIERHAQEHVGGTLVHLQGQLVIRHVELEEVVAGR